MNPAPATPGEQLDRLSAVEAPPGPAELRELAEAVEHRAVADARAAIAAGEAVVALADARDDAELRARSRRALAQALAYAGRFEESLAAAAAGREIASAAGATVEAARCRLASLHSLAALGRYDDAVAAGEAARAALVDAGKPDLAARADLNLGAVFAMRDDPRTALTYLDRARPAFAGDPAILAQLETNRGNALAAIDDHDGALEAFESAVAAFEAGAQPLAAAIAEGNLGHLAARRGDIAGALRHFERSRRKVETAESPAHRIRLQAEQAAVTGALGLPADSLQTLQETIPRLDEMGLVAESARARLAAGRAAIELGLPAAAHLCLERAAAQLEETGQPTLLAETNRLRAGLLLHEGDLAGAERLAHRAFAATTDRPADRCLSASLLARVALARGDLEPASCWLEIALADASRLAISPLLAELHLLRGQLERERGRPARAAFAEAVAETERIRGTLQAARFRSAFHADRLAPYVELMLATLDEGGAAHEAFGASELLKSRTLIDLVGGGRLAGEADGDPLHAELRRLRAELNWHYSRLDAPGGEIDLGRVQSLERQVGELEARIAVLARNEPGSAAVAAMDEIAAALSHGDAGVAYAIAGDELLAFVIRARSVSVFRRLATPAELLDAIRRLRLQIARVRPAGASPDRLARVTIDARRELHRLWSLLLAPLAREVEGAARLVVSPHGLLHSVPFAALWDGARYVVERFEVAHTPSLSLFTRLAPSRGLSGGRVVLAGVPDEFTPRLPAEIASVADTLAGALTLRDGEATVDRVARAMEGAAVVHLACHGRYLRELPGASGLRLADAWLTPDRIAGLDLAGSHVTLSACETGRATIEAGDELIGLTRAFYAAGASSLIVSMWPVHDDSTSLLMERFYRNALAGMSYSGALRSAQAGAIARGDHPAHWAAFVYGGR